MAPNRSSHFDHGNRHDSNAAPGSTAHSAIEIVEDSDDDEGKMKLKNNNTLQPRHPPQFDHTNTNNQDSLPMFEAKEQTILSSLPDEIKARFGQICFAKFGREYLPALVLHPFRVPPGAVRDKWHNMYNTCSQKNRISNVTNLVHWYEDDWYNGFTFITSKNIKSYNEGVEKGWHKLPPNIVQQIERGETLSIRDEKKRRALQHMAADLKRTPEARGITQEGMYGTDNLESFSADFQGDEDDSEGEEVEECARSTDSRHAKAAQVIGINSSATCSGNQTTHLRIGNTEKLTTEEQSILSSLPEDIKSRFGEICFARFDKYLTYRPVLVINPFQLPKGGIRDKWYEKYNTYKSKNQISRMENYVHWYGISWARGFNFFESKDLLSYEEGSAQGCHLLPEKITKKMVQEEPLLRREQHRFDALKEMNDDLNEVAERRGMTNAGMYDIPGMSESKKHNSEGQDKLQLDGSKPETTPNNDKDNDNERSVIENSTSFPSYNAIQPCHERSPGGDGQHSTSESLRRDLVASSSSITFPPKTSVRIKMDKENLTRQHGGFKRSHNDANTSVLLSSSSPQTLNEAKNGASESVLNETPRDFRRKLSRLIDHAKSRTGRPNKTDHSTHVTGEQLEVAMHVWCRLYRDHPDLMTTKRGMIKILKALAHDTKILTQELVSFLKGGSGRDVSLSGPRIEEVERILSTWLMKDGRLSEGGPSPKQEELPGNIQMDSSVEATLALDQKARRDATDLVPTGAAEAEDGDEGDNIPGGQPETHSKSMRQASSSARRTEHGIVENEEQNTANEEEKEQSDRDILKMILAEMQSTSERLANLEKSLREMKEAKTKDNQSDEFQDTPPPRKRNRRN